MSKSAFEKVSSEHLPNCFRITKDVYSGGQPKGIKGFQELADLGIRTVISVDGARPNVKLASEYGVRYVHLPHGYDGVSAETQKCLAVAIKNLDGPFYIHCHHGIHRSPAAAAVACISLGEITNHEGLQFLKLAGTSQQYTGLFRSVEQANALVNVEVAQVNAMFPSVATTSHTVDAMVAIDACFHLLEHGSENEWKVLVDHPDSTFKHEALMLKEHFTELLRVDTEREPEYVEMLAQSKSLSLELETLLSVKKKLERNQQTEANALIKKIKQYCQSCHKQYRDNIHYKK